MTELIHPASSTAATGTADLSGLALVAEAEGLAHESKSPLRLALRRFRRNWVAMIALVVLIVIVLACLFPSIPARYGEIERLPITETAYTNSPPSSEAWFGTDELNRDLYSRIFYGGRVSILIGISRRPDLLHASARSSVPSSGYRRRPASTTS